MLTDVNWTHDLVCFHGILLHFKILFILLHFNLLFTLLCLKVLFVLLRFKVPTTLSFSVLIGCVIRLQGNETALIIPHVYSVKSDIVLIKIFFLRM